MIEPGLICISGSHRVGKSTAARRLASALGAEFFDGSSGRIMRELGYNAVADMSLTQRVRAQFSYLREYQRQLGLALVVNPRRVTDRCPLDMLAYMLAEVKMHSDADCSPLVKDYVDTCLAVTDSQPYTRVFILRPFPGTYDVQPDKPPPNIAYQKHIQLLIEGAAAQLRHTRVSVVEISDLEERVQQMANFADLE